MDLIRELENIFKLILVEELLYYVKLKMFMLLKPLLEINKDVYSIFHQYIDG